MIRVLFGIVVVIVRIIVLAVMFFIVGLFVKFFIFRLFFHLFFMVLSFFTVIIHEVILSLYTVFRSNVSAPTHISLTFPHVAY